MEFRRQSRCRKQNKTSGTELVRFKFKIQEQNAEKKGGKSLRKRLLNN